MGIIELMETREAVQDAVANAVTAHVSLWDADRVMENLRRRGFEITKTATRPAPQPEGAAVAGGDK